MKGSRVRFERLQLSEDDLAQAGKFGLYFLEHGLHTPQSASNIVGVAFSMAIVVAYSRPFHRSMDRNGEYDGPLPQTLLGCLTRTQSAVHERLLLIRNKEFAHSDAARHQIQVVGFAGTPGVIKRQPFVPLPEFDVRTMMEIIELLIDSLSEPKAAAHAELVGEN